MRVTYFLPVLAITIFSVVSCNSGSDKKETTREIAPDGDKTTQTTTTDNKTDDESKGIGKFKNVTLTHPLDEKMVASGKAIYDMKCGSCHKLSEEKLVGPGWKAVTDRRTPEWIMNFVTNTDEMLAKNKDAKDLYEVCLVKMPNQNLKDEDARNILEFMRNNDGAK